MKPTDPQPVPDAYRCGDLDNGWEVEDYEGEWGFPGAFAAPAIRPARRKAPPITPRTKRVPLHHLKGHADNRLVGEANLTMSLALDEARRERDDLAQTLYDFDEWLGDKADEVRAVAHRTSDLEARASLLTRANALMFAHLVLREMRPEGDV